MDKIEQKPIETERLILRPFTASDLNDVFEYASNPEVTKFLLWDAHKTLKESQDFLSWVDSVTCAHKGKAFFVYAIWSKEKKRVIGSIDFKNTNKFGGQIDYALGRPHWGQGYASEAAKALKVWAFDCFPEMVRLQAYCLPENIGSRRVMEKVGMQYEGLRRKSFVIKDRPVDLVHYALIKS